jgi:hypothetical protein
MEKENIVSLIIGVVLGISGSTLFTYISSAYENRNKFKKRDENDGGSTINDSQ